MYALNATFSLANAVNVNATIGTFLATVGPIPVYSPTTPPSFKALDIPSRTLQHGGQEERRQSLRQKPELPPWGWGLINPPHPRVYPSCQALLDQLLGPLNDARGD